MHCVVARNAPHLREIVQHELLCLGYGCSLNHIDVSRVDDFSWLFNESEFDGDISGWDMSNATNLTAMFRQSYFGGDISHWNTKNVVHAGLLFAYCPFNGDISRWNTSKLVDAYDMFGHSGFSGNVAAWDVSAVVNMNGMFANSEFSGDVSSWQVGRVRDMDRMFDQLHGTFNLRGWVPQRLRKAEAFVSGECLDAMDEPCFYHWYAALTQGYQLRSPWQQYLTSLLPIVKTFHRYPTGIAVCMQEQWIQQGRAYSEEFLSLPSLED